MNSYDKLYNETLGKAVRGDIGAIFEGDNVQAFDAHHLDCLLNPKKYAPVVRLGPCNCADKDCKSICFYNAISTDENGNAVISPQDCAGCGDCLSCCNNLIEIKEAVSIFKHIAESEAPVYALIAPAYTGQFSKEVTPGRLRSAFKQLGFAGMIEVALFADVLTLKEALEFDREVKNPNDFLLTSCCCPMWVAMIRKVYAELAPHMPPSVSPMVACGRAVKHLYPNAITVFVGPCVAKKAEARQKDISDAVDYVLTFDEMRDILAAAGINPAALKEDLRDHSSKAGRIYARTGGVSEAVQATVKRLMPQRDIPLVAMQGDGVAACKAMLRGVQSGQINANFLEGMGCVGGCVGGPKALIDAEEGAAHVNEYGEEAASQTPADNPYVLELLGRLGFDSIEALLEKETMFKRDFSQN